MIEKVISVSKENVFSKLYLDTALFMSSAVTLYKKFGFKETGSFPECIVPKELWDWFWGIHFLNTPCSYMHANERIINLSS